MLAGILGSAGNTTSVQANSVNWYQDGLNTIVTVDVTGDTTADLSITLTNFNATELDNTDIIF